MSADAGRRRGLAALALAVACGAAACGLSELAYHVVPRPQPLEELAYYPSGRHLASATLGHRETAADLAWLRAVQYYGEHRITDNRYDRMEHVFDILTTLSPGFVPAYVFAGFALAQEGQNFPAAERLMLKGMDLNPRSGLLAFELGFLYYVRPGGRELPNAAECFELASYQPDAPPQARRFAAFARQNSGNLYVSFELWREIYQSTRNPYVREAAQRGMSEIAQAIAEHRAGAAEHHLGVPLVQVNPR